MQKPFDPYGGEIATQQPAPHGPTEEYGGKVAEQVEMSRRALAYRSRFETELPPTGDVSRGSGKP
jgi:hypothetical protein